MYITNLISEHYILFNNVYVGRKYIYKIIHIYSINIKVWNETDMTQAKLF